MNNLIKNILFFYIFIFQVPNLFGYNLPGMNLGISNMLDGGPIRPSPGFYFFQYLHYYYSNKFVDNCGNKIKGIKNPCFNYLSGASQLVYQTDDDFLLNCAGGLSFVLPYTMTSHINKNEDGLIDKSTGLGNFEIGTYLQSKPFYYHNRPIFVNRIEIDFIIPKKRKEEHLVIYPATHFFYIDTNWSATFYLKENLALSWRLNYLINFKDKINDKLIGNAFYTNYSLSYNATKNLWIGINGYYLQQLQNDKIEGKIIKDSKERVLGIGPGAVYFFSKDLVAFAHLYFESLVKNRPQGISFAANIAIHF